MLISTWQPMCKMIEATVRLNRQTLIDTLALARQPLWLNQIHSSDCIINIGQLFEPSADASFTCHSGAICAVLSADCLPLLVCSNDGEELAAVHAGWRGLLSGVIGNTLSRFVSPGHKLQAWLGPTHFR